MDRKLVFVARDGKEFYDEKECQKHEETIWFTDLVGMTAAQVKGMVDGADEKRHKLLREAYNRSQKGRRERGEVVPRGKGQEPNGADQSQTQKDA